MWERKVDDQVWGLDNFTHSTDIHQNREHWGRVSLWGGRRDWNLLGLRYPRDMPEEINSSSWGPITS